MARTQILDKEEGEGKWRIAERERGSGGEVSWNRAADWLRPALVVLQCLSAEVLLAVALTHRTCCLN